MIARFDEFRSLAVTYNSTAIWKLYYSVSFVISHCVPNSSRSGAPRRLTRGEFDRAKVCAPNIQIRETRMHPNARERFFRFDDFEVPGVAERTSSAQLRRKRCSRIVRRAVSFTVIECYPRYVNIMRVELHGHAASWKCSFARLQCNAWWLPRYRTSNVEFSNAPVRCLCVEIADNFGKKIQSKWLIYLLIDELRSDEIIPCGFSSSSFNRASKTVNIITQAL